ncbi:MAG TPA: hypothetical protein VKS82_11370 [Streptosporangiaceae bacterium]|nr:hypothetical protein [Streptosporangiaceae bacterium]
MTVRREHLGQARQVADAILYEGYLLYPYRKSAQKNRARFQFGVLMPPAYATVDACEPSASQAEFLVECRPGAELWVLIRFLHLRRRIVQGVDPVTGRLRETARLLVDGTEYTRWDEATDREHRIVASVDELLAAGAAGGDAAGDGAEGGSAELAIHVEAGQESEDITDAAGSVVGRLIHRWDTLDAMAGVHLERLPGPYGVLRCRVRVENRSQPAAELRNRDDGLRCALISAHALIGAEDGTFLSMTDPPEWASKLVAECTNTGMWPVLAGPRDCGNLMMASPIILYDHPEIAPESAGDLFDATEIDEILTLRTLTLTDEEKAEARATDPRAADLMDRLDGLPPEILEKMHGAIRYLAPAGGPVPTAPPPSGPQSPPEVTTPGEYTVQRPSVPWWDPGADTSVSPQTDHVVVNGVRVAKGSRVVLRPGSRRADAQDLFLAGRAAVVEAVLFDVDGQVHVAVTPDGDPLLADLQRTHGRFLYFSPDEIEPGRPGRPKEEAR